MAEEPMTPPHPDLIQARIDQAVLQTKVEALEARLMNVEKMLTDVHGLLTEARGGWKTMVALGGVVGTLASFVTWILTGKSS